MLLTPSERKELAAKVQVNEQYLYQCLTGRRDMDPVEAIRVERESEGLVTRFQLCSRRGVEIWPELAQQHGTRPFLDLAPALRQRAVAAGEA